jgi:exonuclease SbcD
MKILHTSDWHLGKKLEGNSRIKEQEKFIENLIKIADGESVDMILIAGDIYDVPNPPTEAEKLFFKGIKSLSNNGKRPVIVIPGNHDNPERLGASSPLADEYGIIIFSKPFEKKEIGKYGTFEITNSTYGGIEIEVNSKKAFIYALPYPSEKALGETFGGEKDQEQLSYSQRIGEILKDGMKEKSEDSIGIVMTHIYMTGSICSDDERPIELGGSLAVNLNDLPDVDYIALGHIHKPMVYKDKRAVYSGSPIEYRVSENKYAKKVFIANLNGNLDTEIKGIEVENYKPIKRYVVNSIEEGIEKSQELLDANEWIYLEIKTERPLQNNEVREIKKNSNIIEIIPIINWNTEDENGVIIENLTENIENAFSGFYKEKYNVEPSTEVLEVFHRLLGEVK